MTHHDREELLHKIDKALKLSALKAREIAYSTNTPLVIEEDGEIKHIKISAEDIKEYRELIKDALTLQSVDTPHSTKK